MQLDPATHYPALCARDVRYDGVFFVGVRTTGIYCRPICPARTPARARCAFFTYAAEAEHAGFRACFRCRPELAPGLATIDAIPRLVRAAIAEIDAGALNDGSVDALAGKLHVTARHLRRAMEAELGVSPIAYAQTRRLALAKQLLHDTALPLAAVAFAAGFASVRRFNALFSQRFERSPSAVRRLRATSPPSDSIAVRLEARPPFDWSGLLTFLAARAIPGVEHVEGDEYQRSVSIDGCDGWLTVRASKVREAALVAQVSLSLAPKLTAIVHRLRALFDLDARPDLARAHLRRDPVLRPLLRKRPGLRVPGAFDPFEMAVRAVLGQQVSVRAATTLSGRLAAAFGRPIAPAAPAADKLRFYFPSAAALARVDVETMRRIGLPEARARTVLSLASAVAEGRVQLSDAADPQSTIEQLQLLPGVGPWTAHYLAMRALRWPDAFPASDLGLRKSLGVSTVRAAEARAQIWRPFRAYAVMQLWCSLPSCPDGG